VPLSFGNVGMAKMIAWWRGTGGNVCAGISLGKGKEQMESHTIISEPYQGLDES